MDSTRPGPVETPTSNTDSKDPLSPDYFEISSAMWNQLIQWYSEAKQENSETKRNIIRLKYFSPKGYNQKVLILHCRPTVSAFFSLFLMSDHPGKTGGSL